MFPLINDEGIVEPDCWKISNYETKGPGHSHQWQVTAQYYVPSDGSVLEKTSHLSEIKPHDLTTGLQEIQGLRSIFKVLTEIQPAGARKWDILQDDLPWLFNKCIKRLKNCVGSGQSIDGPILHLDSNKLLKKKCESVGEKFEHQLGSWRFKKIPVKF